MRVYFNEYNVMLERTAYLPLVSGILKAHALQNTVISSRYDFQPFLFLQDIPENLLRRYDDPAAAFFSSSMWNEQLNLRLAELIKERYPECLVVFGGAQMPHQPKEYFAKHPFIDIGVRGEGERPFVEILERFLESRSFDGIANIAWRDPETGACVRNDEDNPLEKDLDIYPSPYLEGLFEYLFVEHPELQFQAIVETNRGCPFLCSFCFWGQGGLSLKFRFHSIDRLRAEIEWAAHHKIRYMFNADSNFGMHKRDAEIGRILVDTKQRYGYPEKFRTCFGKNTDERIFSLGSLLHNHQMEKGITLSRQSMNDRVLENIDRKNIKMSTYYNLQNLFNAQGIPVYTELILGLPGESIESWRDGIEILLGSGLKNQLFVHMCQIFPNTTMADPDYIRKFGIQTSRVELSEIHGAIRKSAYVTEYEHIVVSTNDMPVEDWCRAALFSWMTMLLHSLKAGFFILMYLNDRLHVRYTDLIRYISDENMPEGTGAILRNELNEMRTVTDRIRDGKSRARELPEFGEIYWDVEEASLFRVMTDPDRFYDELEGVVLSFLNENQLTVDKAELAEAFKYQRLRMPHWSVVQPRTTTFRHNFPEYFECGFLGHAIPLEQTEQTMTISNPRTYDGDRMRYAREVILWGRKSDVLLEEVTWRNTATKLNEAVLSVMY